MRLIDADAKIKMLLYDEEHEEQITREMTVKEALDLYTEDGCPTTIDAVEVVRCKDCKYYESKCDYPFCYYTENNVETDDYCSFGEKKEVEE